jgi:adenine deaminase
LTQIRLKPAGSWTWPSRICTSTSPHWVKRAPRIRGAIATSYSHDSHNLVVLGRDAEDMALAANQLIASGGGMGCLQ